MDVLSTYKLEKEALLLLGADTVTLNGSKLHLFTNDISPTRSDDGAAYTAATSTGLAPVTITTWSAPYVDPGGIVRIDGGSHSFIVTAPAVGGETIYGWWLTGGADTVSLGAGRLPEPIGISAAGQGFEIDISLPWGG